MLIKLTRSSTKSQINYTYRDSMGFCFRNGTMESAHFVRGDHTLKVPMSLFRENRRRLVDRLLANPKAKQAGSYVLLQGGVDVPFNDTDVNWPFRQVRWYNYFSKTCQSFLMRAFHFFIRKEGIFGRVKSHTLLLFLSGYFTFDDT